MAAADVAPVAGFAAVAAAAGLAAAVAGLVADAAGGAGVWSLAARALAANIRIRAVCFMVSLNSR